MKTLVLSLIVILLSLCSCYDGSLSDEEKAILLLEWSTGSYHDSDCYYYWECDQYGCYEVLECY
jgi:hypothetical protein